MARTTRYFAKNQAHPKAEATPVDVESLGNNRYAVTIAGKRVEVESIALPQQAMSMLVGGRSYAVEFETRGDEIAALVNGQVTRFDLVDERKLRQRAANSTFSAEGTQVVTAPMPGKVVKILVKAGDAVTEGQGLVVVEAMKMENELKSPKAGVVKEILSKEGAVVENGAKLLMVE